MLHHILRLLILIGAAAPASLLASYSVNRLDHSYEGCGGDIMKFNFQNMMMRKPNERLCAFSCLGEVNRESAVYYGPTGASIDFLVYSHPKTRLPHIYSEDNYNGSWKSVTNHYIRKYGQRKHQPNPHGWTAAKVLVNRIDKLIHGACLVNGDIYTNVSGADLTSISNSTSGDKEFAFATTSPGSGSPNTFRINNTKMTTYK